MGSRARELPTLSAAATCSGLGKKVASRALGWSCGAARRSVLSTAPRRLRARGRPPEIEIYYKCNFGSRFVRSGHALRRADPPRTARIGQCVAATAAEPAHVTKALRAKRSARRRVWLARVGRTDGSCAPTAPTRSRRQHLDPRTCEGSDLGTAQRVPKSLIFAKPTKLEKALKILILGDSYPVFCIGPAQTSWENDLPKFGEPLRSYSQGRHSTHRALNLPIVSHPPTNLYTPIPHVPVSQ